MTQQCRKEKERKVKEKKWKNRKGLHSGGEERRGEERRGEERRGEERRGDENKWQERKRKRVNICPFIHGKIELVLFGLIPKPPSLVQNRFRTFFPSLILLTDKQTPKQSWVKTCTFCSTESVYTGRFYIVCLHHISKANPAFLPQPHPTFCFQCFLRLMHFLYVSTVGATKKVLNNFSLNFLPDDPVEA